MKKNRALAYSEFILVYCFYLFLNILPVGLSLKIGRFLGIVFYKLDKKHRKHTLNNLKIAFPDKTGKELNDISIEFYKNLGMVFVEIFRLGKYNADNIDDFVESNFDSVKNIYKKQGILLLTAHFGNWELLAKTFGLKGYPGNVLARPLDNPFIEKILYKLRRIGSGNKVIYNRENAIKSIMSALNGNEIVGFLPDENASKRIGVFVDFFGIKACTMPGMANIAAKTKLPVVPAFIVRLNERNGNMGGGNYAKHRLIIEPPLDIKYTGDRKTDTMNILRMFNEKIEDIIKLYPEQWFWIHNRWKTRPDNQDSSIDKDLTTIGAASINPEENINKCVFLDRDGVLIKDVGYLKKPEDIIIMPGSIEALKVLKGGGFLLIIVTNQAGIAKGFFNMDDLATVNNKLLKIYEDNGIIIDDLYFCPHHEKGTVEPYNIRCSCRKPETGMVLKGVEKFNIDTDKSFMVGDKDSDILLAKNSGLKSFYAKNPMYEHDENIEADFYVKDLREAAEIIIKTAVRSLTLNK